IVIVPNDQADPALPMVDDIKHAIISTITTAGAPDDGPPVLANTTDGSGNAATANPAPSEPVFDPLEVQPAFPGGVEAWRNFLSKYLQAPDELEAGERRTVQVRFMVSATGEVTDFAIVQSAGTSFDREVLRVMKKMPKWTPAIQNGHHIAVSFVQPVTFQGIEE
ncbi:MAG TPA: energy transducer TonB, partial [Flavisolibacter sp.]|nr:energy transducer TonB [Flavisolibacter sp.]